MRIRKQAGRRRVASAAALAAVVFALFGVLSARADNVPSDTLGNFEADGNMVTDTGGQLDWDSVTPTQVIDDTLDSGFKGSSKENDPSGWSCNNGGGSPPKANILRAYVNARVTGASAFLDLAFVRAKGTGDTHINFELDHNDISNPCPNNARVDGDLFISFDFPGGGGSADISTYKWDSSVSTDGEWVPFALPAGSAAGGTNTSAITDVITGDPICDRCFGEATLDMKKINEAIGGGLLDCPGAGFVNFRSRSSGESFSSALQDRLPQATVDLSTCGSVKIKKTDDAGNPLAGAEFGLFDNPNATGQPVATCTSDGQGICKFTSVVPGDYTIKETSAPAGYDPDPDIVPVTVAANEDKDLTASPFVDPLQTGFVKVTKVLHDDEGGTVIPSDPNVLNGTTFALYQDVNTNGVMDNGEQANTWPGGVPAQCVLAGGSNTCTIGPVETASYRVAETVGPPHSTSAGDVDVIVTKGTTQTAAPVTYINILDVINITLNKAAGETFAEVGDTIHYTFDVTTTGPRLHNVTLADNTGICDSTPVFTASSDTGSDGFLEVGETWHYTCSHVVTAGDSDPVVNTAKVTGTDDYGRTTTSTDSASVDIIHPGAIQIVKSGPEFAHVGDTVTYTMVVTNNGATGITEVVVSDPICNGTSLQRTANGNGDEVLDASESWTYTCTHLVTANDPDPLPNTAVVSGTSETGPVDDADNHSVDILHPGISIDKTADPVSAEPGQTVTYSYKVTNTGDAPLHDVKVTDDKLGDIGTIALLLPGQSQTLTKSVVIAGDSPTDNVGPVNGTDVLGKTVTANDTAHIDIVLGLVLARTGFEATTWAVVGLALVALGFLMLLHRAPVLEAQPHRTTKIRVRLRK